MLVASLAPAIGHFFTSLEHKISPIGIAAIALAVVALLAYVVLWLVSRNQRPSLAAVLEPYRMTGAQVKRCPGRRPSSPCRGYRGSRAGCKRRWA